MVKRSPTLGTLISTNTKCIKLIFIGKITLVPVAFLMALSIYTWKYNVCIIKLETKVMRLHKIWVEKISSFLRNKYAAHGF